LKLSEGGNSHTGREKLLESRFGKKEVEMWDG